MIPIDSKVYIAGHGGMVGSAIMRILAERGITNIITRTRQELDLTNQHDVDTFFNTEKPEYVILSAAKVGGIHANNTYPAEFIYTNLMIESNVIHASYINNVKGLLFLGSSCIYPREAGQPMSERSLLTGVLEPTNEPYALAKIAGIKLCESYNRQHGTDYRSIMPTNLYGQEDNFHAEDSHVVPALMRRFHDAKVRNDERVVIWGSGNVMREFLHVDDMASASMFVFDLDKSEYQEATKPMLSHINVGTGIDCTIREMAEIMKNVTGFKGELSFDTSKPDGAPRKLLDVCLLNKLGWQSGITLEKGLTSTYQWYLENFEGHDIRH